METVIEHVIETTVAAPPPRVARLPRSTSLLLLAAAILFAVFIYGGSRAILESWKLAWLGMTGQIIPAQITQVQTEPAAVKGEPDRPVGLRYTYSLPFGTDHALRTGYARLEPPDAGDPMRPPQNLPTTRQPRVAMVLPVFHVGDLLPLRGTEWLGHPLVYPWQAAPTGKIVFLFLCGGLVIGISAFLLRRIGRWYTHRSRLLRNGIATIGTIIHKDARAEDAPRYYIRYGYAAGTEPLEREEQVSIEQWKRLEVGQPVTVLYDADHTSDAGLYALIGT